MFKCIILYDNILLRRRNCLSACPFNGFLWFFHYFGFLEDVFSRNDYLFTYLGYLKFYLTTLAIHNIFVKIQWVDFQMGRVILTNYLN